MKPLQLPPTIRTARPDEVPGQDETFLIRIQERESANITEGYTFRYNETHDLPFKFFAEINVDNSKLWELFKALLLQLPDEICVVCNYKDGDANFSPYADKYTVLNRLGAYQVELTQDGYLEAGVLFNDETFMEEVFIKAPKYLQYWGMDELRFKGTMEEFELYESPQLNFIDEFPLVTESLSTHDSGAATTSEVLAKLSAIGVE